MIEEHLRDCIYIPQGHRLVRQAADAAEADEDRVSTCQSERFQLLDARDNLVCRYKAWQVDNDFFGYFEYDTDDTLVDRKTVTL
ncbi:MULTISPECIES: hypothetical protein [Marinobacter]|uniref:hypothetical protein n=1 Tax=Marinobacter TaxID=2742 RepID=UPI000DACC365|nr:MULTISPECIES: hypothetical protein [Marinobacter]